ncbi:putative nuclear polyadenylated RNA-binding protein NAB2 [Monocercomonoides exilis]|uniref:putative nuclear polyadenylated RNA-binding protein NAB2 n=1 Tax=Monocercomonoides exilis TaxID=2049356 RepID=UPI003559FA58|nr:putative nuclear polyadenylated RNA-binding protein NAB2 [Monocercomonoides exilis]|eukprot:MONOS_10221.1-p1 / transcript=MONOS_10221.1 / gene=MONOS_10221 / organism=Monocercomonoides_exilis_PA203 / gene_product=unspecified product / transcript_product=unspecified product / location=Mono_scaffold00455:26164-28651(-) / protein_length=777 / sequence_SO=supercontig / SO=protein_coding / is_pseudo=false
MHEYEFESCIIELEEAARAIDSDFSTIKTPEENYTPSEMEKRSLRFCANKELQLSAQIPAYQPLHHVSNGVLDMENVEPFVTEGTGIRSRYGGMRNGLIDVNGSSRGAESYIQQPIFPRGPRSTAGYYEPERYSSSVAQGSSTSFQPYGTDRYSQQPYASGQASSQMLNSAAFRPNHPLPLLPPPPPPPPPSLPPPPPQHIYSDNQRLIYPGIAQRPASGPFSRVGILQKRMALEQPQDRGSGIRAAGDWEQEKQMREMGYNVAAQSGRTVLPQPQPPPQQQQRAYFEDDLADLAREYNERVERIQQQPHPQILPQMQPQTQPQIQPQPQPRLQWRQPVQYSQRAQSSMNTQYQQPNQQQLFRPQQQMQMQMQMKPQSHSLSALRRQKIAGSPAVPQADEGKAPMQTTQETNTEAASNTLPINQQETEKRVEGAECTGGEDGKTETSVTTPSSASALSDQIPQQQPQQQKPQQQQQLHSKVKMASSVGGGGGSSSGVGSMGMWCPKGASCERTGCELQHPPAPCRFWPNCTRWDCPFSHGHPCREDMHCTKPMCAFSHYPSFAARPLCMFGMWCTNPICAYRHPPQRKLGVGLQPLAKTQPQQLQQQIQPQPKSLQEKATFSSSSDAPTQNETVTEKKENTPEEEIKQSASEIETENDSKNTAGEVAKTADTQGGSEEDSKKEEKEEENVLKEEQKDIEVQSFDMSETTKEITTESEESKKDPEEAAEEKKETITEEHEAKDEQTVTQEVGDASTNDSENWEKEKKEETSEKDSGE